MKSPFPPFVFTYRDTRQNGKRKAILKAIKYQQSEYRSALCKMRWYYTNS